MTDTNGHAGSEKHSAEHVVLADSAAVHASSHRAGLGNGSLFDVAYMGDGNYRTQAHPASMDQYLKAHLGFLESIAHSLVAIAAQLEEAADADH